MAMFRGVRYANTQIQREIRKYNYSGSSTLQLQWKLDHTCAIFFNRPWYKNAYDNAPSGVTHTNTQRQRQIKVRKYTDICKYASIHLGPIHFGSSAFNVRGGGFLNCSTLRYVGRAHIVTSIIIVHICVFQVVFVDTSGPRWS